MNNFQNNNRKLVLPPYTAPICKETLRNILHEKKPKEETDSRKTIVDSGLSGPLKIFLESENLNCDETLRESGFKNPNKRSQKDMMLQEKGKEKRVERKIRMKESCTKAAFKKSDYYYYLQSQTAHDRKAAASNPQNPEHVKVNENTENYNKKTTIESKSCLQKNLEGGKEVRRPDVTTKAAEESERALTQKTSSKIIQSSKHEVKPTVSEYRKIHINEILKGHAQKVQSIPSRSSQQFKDYSFQGVTEWLQSAKNALGSTNPSKTENKKEEKEKSEEENKSKKIEETIEKTEVKPSEKSLKVSQAIVVEEGTDGEKNKIPNKWSNVPQSNELERRLKGVWQETEDLFPRKKSLQPLENWGVGDKNFKKEEEICEKEEEEEKKGAKRTTYTDRLLAYRTLGKEKDGKKSEGGSEVGEDIMKADGNVEKANCIKKLEKFEVRSPLEPSLAVTEPFTKITLSSNKELVTLKDARENPGGEQILKAKATRSAELKDLVTQAVKEHKIFCIFDNHWYIVRPVREELLSRGWLEVIPDRRLIPRRRPPPMGPTCDRTYVDRNCNTLEAILTAKETFVEEIRETVSKSTFKTSLEKPKLACHTATTTKKSSEESLNEVLSLFRIIPPTPEKKKNNFEIREFISKNPTPADKDKDKEKKEKEKNPRLFKKEKGKSSSPDADRNKTSKAKVTDNSKTSSTEVSIPTPLTKSLQAILDTISDNNKAIQEATKLNLIEGKPGERESVNILFMPPAKNLAAIDQPKPQEKTQKSSTGEKSSKVLYSDTDSKIISKLIQSTNARIHFMWLSIKPSIHLKCFNYNPEIINKFQKTTFCTKIGLWNHLNNIQWYAHEVHYPAKSPRMYNTGEADDLQAFFQDFQLTACIGMLKWLADTFFDRGIKAVQAKKGKVPLKAFEFAIKQCERYVRFKENEDLSIFEQPKVLQEEWNTFLQWFYIITNDHGKLQESSSSQLMVVYTKAVDTIRTMKRYWPEIEIDGRLNIWIMKPYCASCGRGIFMTNNVYYIGQHSKYIVQKYIEKPLLIYNTKFDIRQWFMITKLTPLEIWMYKECYLRFCTQPFALRNLHESVHLSNNSVQRKYVSFLDPGLPDQNMWDSNTFQLYLKTIGHPTTWQDIIYPGMKDAIVSTMLAAQDTFDGPRRSWFEVYGADFMLSANLKEGPWLIEINENPAMDPSTKVTARLCPQMLRDVIKVVVDKKLNKNASTGEWELIYRQNYSPSFGTIDLDVKGKKIARIPPTIKVGLNFSQQCSTSTTTDKRYSGDEVQTKSLYEVVKSFDAVQNSKGDAKDMTPSLIGKSGDTNKTVKNTKHEKNVQTKKLEQTEESDSKLNKGKTCKMHSLGGLEDKTNNKETKAKKEENHDEDKKTFDKALEESERKAIPGMHSRESKNVSSKEFKDDKNSGSVVSVKNRHRKQTLNNSSSRKPLKQTNLSEVAPEAKKNISNSDSYFRANDIDPAVNSNQLQKFKFTKFYKL